MPSVDDFYKLASGDGAETVPEPPQEPSKPENNPALEAAKERAVNYKSDKKIYIVRGDSLFSIDSLDVKVTRKGDLRDIVILNAVMVKL